ncbi:MAG TPA: hypothetical protein V6D47_02680 [Oscillatoriaceae cyanobacterium]
MADEQACLRRARAITDDYLAGLSEPQAALTGREAGKHQQAIAARIDAAFPSYALRDTTS